MKKSKKARIEALTAEVEALTTQLDLVKEWRYNWFEPTSEPTVRAHVRALDRILPLREKKNFHG